MVRNWLARVGAIAPLAAGWLGMLSPAATAQAPTLYHQYQRPASMATCTTEDCWVNALSSCTPSTYRAILPVPIFTFLTADQHMEVWGDRGAGCLVYRYTFNIWAEDTPMPELAGVHSLCLYSQPADALLVWEVFRGRRTATLGGEAGIVDPATNVARTTEDVDGRRVAVCDMAPPLSS